MAKPVVIFFENSAFLRRPQKFGVIFHLFWHLLSKSADLSKQLEDNCEILCSSQKSWTLTSLYYVCSMYYILHDIITNWKDQRCLLTQIQRSCYIGMVLFCRLLSLCAIYNGSKTFSKFIFLCNHVFKRYFFNFRAIVSYYFSWKGLCIRIRKENRNS